MSKQLTIDSAGRVVIPKPLRDALALEPGDTLEVEGTGEQITLRPLRAVAPLTKEKGVWVFRTGQPLTSRTTEDVLTDLRGERDRRNLGLDQ